MGNITTYSSTNLNKYSCSDPLTKRLINNFCQTVLEIINNIDHSRILNLGCGEGLDVKYIYLKNNLRFDLCCGLDIQFNALRYAREEIDNNTFHVINGDIYDIPFKLSEFNLISCLEVLEHLEFPEKVLQDIAANYTGYCIFSVPNEPFYRLTRMILGRQDIRHFGNHPGHLHCWTKRGIRLLLKKYFHIHQICVSSLWIIVLCHTREKSK